MTFMGTETLTFLGFRAQGRVEVQDAAPAEVVFRDVWFGGTPALQGVQGCGSRFIREQ